MKPLYEYLNSSSRGSKRLEKLNKEYLMELIFKEYDENKNHRFSRVYFPTVLRSLARLIGADQPYSEDMEDLFNLLDLNGDETIDRKYFMSLINTFFDLLEEYKIEIYLPANPFDNVMGQKSR